MIKTEDFPKVLGYKQPQSYFDLIDLGYVIATIIKEKLGLGYDKYKISNNGIRNIKTSGLFVAIGRVPNNEEFKDLINLDDYGYIIAKEDCHTNVKGIFVSGDNRTKDLRQLVTATSDGAIAATEAIKYISKNNK